MEKIWQFKAVSKSVRLNIWQVSHKNFLFYDAIDEVYIEETSTWIWIVPRQKVQTSPRGNILVNDFYMYIYTCTCMCLIRGIHKVKESLRRLKEQKLSSDTWIYNLGDTRYVLRITSKVHKYFGAHKRYVQITECESN